MKVQIEENNKANNMKTLRSIGNRKLILWQIFGT